MSRFNAGSQPDLVIKKKRPSVKLAFRPQQQDIVGVHENDEHLAGVPIVPAEKPKPVQGKPSGFQLKFNDYLSEVAAELD